MLHALITQREGQNMYGKSTDVLEADYTEFYESMGIRLHPVSNFTRDFEALFEDPIDVLTATGVSATIVPTLVPIEREMKQAAMKMPASSRLSGSICKVRFTVASMAPICLALWANAPARMNIHTISMMFLLAAPMEYCSIRSFRLRPLVMHTAQKL